MPDAGLRFNMHFMLSSELHSWELFNEYGENIKVINNRLESRECYTSRVLDKSDPRWRCIICECTVYVQKHTSATATVKKPLNSDHQDNDKDLG